MLLEERRFEGEWWIPGEAAGAAHGVLEFKADQFDLALDSAILDRPGPGPGVTVIRVEEIEVPVIHGTTDDGDLTLLGARAMVDSHYTGLEALPTWWPRLVLVGAHLEADTTFERALLRTEHLDEWACTPPLRRDVVADSDVARSVGFTAERQVIDAAEVGGLGSVELVAVPVWSATRLEAEVRLQAVIQISVEQPLRLQELLERVNLVRGFVRTCVGAPAALVEVHVTPTAKRRSVSVLFRSVAFGGKPSRPVGWHQMLVAYPELPSGLGAALAAWAEAVRHHEQAWFRLCATDHLQLTNTDEAFVAYTKAIDALHEGDFEKSGAAEAESEDRISRTLELLPEGLADWAEPVLRANTKPPVARFRIQELVESLGDLGHDLSGGDPEGFARRVSATRNGLTHIRRRHRANYLFDDRARYEYGRALHYLGTAYLLQQAGIPLDQLTARCRTQHEISTVISRVGSYERRWTRTDHPV